MKSLAFSVFFMLAVTSLFSISQAEENTDTTTSSSASSTTLSQEVVIGRLSKINQTEGIMHPFLIVSAGKYVDTSVHYDYVKKLLKFTSLDIFLAGIIKSLRQYTIYKMGEQIGTFQVDSFTSDTSFSSLVCAKGHYKTPDALLKKVDIWNGVIGINPSSGIPGSAAIFNNEEENQYKQQAMKEFQKIIDQEKGAEKDPKIARIDKKPPQMQYFRIDNLDDSGEPKVISACSQESEFVLKSNVSATYWIKQFSVVTYENGKRVPLFEWHQRMGEGDNRKLVNSIHVLDLDGDGVKELLVGWTGYDNSWFEIYKMREGKLVKVFEGGHEDHSC